jgi:hypothetical protein
MLTYLPAGTLLLLLLFCVRVCWVPFTLSFQGSGAPRGRFSILRSSRRQTNADEQQTNEVRKKKASRRPSLTPDQRCAGSRNRTNWRYLLLLSRQPARSGPVVCAFVLRDIYKLFGIISGAVEHICHGHACTSTRVLGRHLEHCQCHALR